MPFLEDEMHIWEVRDVYMKYLYKGRFAFKFKDCFGCTPNNKWK